MTDDAAPQSPTDADDQSLTRAPLPEETAAGEGYDEQAASGAILTESEERVNDDDAGIGPGSGDHEHRRSEDTA